MTNLTANFCQITNFAKQYGLPASKKRAILREFLQVKILSLIYAQKPARNLFFVGGTALRLLYGLDRFSEDLDFDAPDLSKTEIKKLIDEILGRLTEENILVDFYHNPKEKKDYYEFRFPEILFETGVSPNKEEKIAIKFDFEFFWKRQKRETITLNKYGILTQVVTKTLPQFAVEKLVAYINRTQNQARDLYDLVWLASQGAKPDQEFAKKNGFEIKDLISKAKKRFQKEKFTMLERGLAPFLPEETTAEKIRFFRELY
jgi:predicted nucleotidyltransferase component of viral defense system